MTEDRRAQVLSMIEGATEAEKREILAFIHLLKERQDRGQTITDQEVQEMAAEARRRIEAHDSP